MKLVKTIVALLVLAAVVGAVVFIVKGINCKRSGDAACEDGDCCGDDE